MPKTANIGALKGMTEWLTPLSQHPHWVYLAIFVISFTESFALIGIAVPGVILLAAAAAVAGQQGMSITVVLLCAYAGAVLGDGISFLLGCRVRDDIRTLLRKPRWQTWLNQGEAFIQRYGVLGVVAGRFIGPLRPVVPLSAGILHMPTWQFFPINMVSAIAWAPVYILPGYFAGRALQTPTWLDALKEHGWVLLALIFLLIGLWQIRKRFTF